MTQSRPFRIGTRASALALWQAHTVRDRLIATHDLGSEDVEIVEVSTTGDRVLDRRLADVGGKGLFTKELEAALDAKEVDCAVHSLKDVPTFLPDGMVLAAYLEREDPRDALILPGSGKLNDLPAGAKVGTASLRREAILRTLRPDFDVVLLRGNVPTRVGKVKDGELDAAVLANAGLIRLGMTDDIAEVLSPDVFLPAVGQGIVAIEIREDDARAQTMVGALNVPESEVAAKAERAFLARLDGSCRSPIAAHLTAEDGHFRFEGALMTPDGKERETVEKEGLVADAELAATNAAQAILDRASPTLLAVLED
ncbi:MAG: hydroxymethylbilane synthase [Pseudomonadota bacterium]